MLLYSDIVFIQGVLLPEHSSGCSRRCDSPAASNTGRLRLLLLLPEEEKGQTLVYVGNGRSCCNDIFYSRLVLTMDTMSTAITELSFSLSHSVSLVYPVTPCLILSQKQGVFFISAQFKTDGRELGSLN